MSKKVYIPTNHIRDLVDTYLLYRSVTILSNGDVEWWPLNRYKDFNHLTADSERAERMMRIYHKHKHPEGNSHFWFLVAFGHSHKKAIDNLIFNHPWSDIGNYITFEEWRQHIESVITRLEGIKDLVWYDVALILSYLLNQHVLPRDVVYVHALPLDTLVKVYQYLGVSPAVIRNIRNDMHFALSSAPSCLAPLNAYQMEDFFCAVGHAVRENNVTIDKVTTEMLGDIVKP